MPFLLELAWRDLRSSGRSLRVFAACLMLGVSLIAGSGGLYSLVHRGLLADTRVLMGGDLEIEANAPLPERALEWIRRQGVFTRVTEIDTMLSTDSEDVVRVELQTTEAGYPLYGQLQLQPALPLASVTAFDGRHWGVAIDPVLAGTLGIGVGDTVHIGSLAMTVRALVLHQPDRSLGAEWSGTPVLISERAVEASGLIQPGSRIEYEYRVRSEVPAESLREQFYAAFPGETWEVNTFRDQSSRLSERLDQMASGLLIIGFSTLFIGGLGVSNSINAYLQGKLKTIATLRALGLRNRRVAIVYLLQTGLLGGGASVLGAMIGGALALLGASAVAERVPMTTTLSNLIVPLLMAIGFGLLTAFAFTLPAIGRALAVQPASLFRGEARGAIRTPRGWWLATSVCGAAIVLLVLAAMPDALFGFGFVLVIALLLALLDSIVRGLRQLARRLDGQPLLTRRFEWRLALANLHRPGAPLRASLLSLGTALTLLVACTLVVASLVRAINSTIPEESPALVLYDIADAEVAAVRNAVAEFPSTARMDTAPLVRSRIQAVNGRAISELVSPDRESRRDAAQDEYKLSYTANNIDAVTLVDGVWWQEPVSGRPKIAMEDREVNQLGLRLGDVVRFAIQGQTLEAEIAAIFSQKGIQTRFWFEGILSNGALQPFISRHVGAAYMDDDEAIAAQRRIRALAPGVVTVRTAALLASAREILGKAAGGLTVVAGVSLIASLLVLISVMVAGRSRQIHDAIVLHALGTRLAVIKRSLYMEYVLLALVTSLFAVVLGSAIALPLLHLQLKLPSADLLWLGVVASMAISVVALGLGAYLLFRRMRLTPAVLLRE